jgi:LAS superfamily LD-carboxypeptidase LdcB
LGNSQDTLPGTFDDHSDARAASLYPTNDGSVHPTVAGLYPDFSNALLAMNAANPHGPVQLMGPRSGFRSMSEQKAIAASVRAKRGANWRKWAAKPGTSKHGWGVAGDLKYASPAQKKWIHENAGKYGLYFPMAHEPWHIQLKNIGDARNLAAAGLVSY